MRNRQLPANSKSMMVLADEDQIGDRKQIEAAEKLLGIREVLVNYPLRKDL